MENSAFHSFTQMQDYYTFNSHYLTYTIALQKVVRMYFLNLGVKGLKHAPTTLSQHTFIEAFPVIP